MKNRRPTLAELHVLWNTRLEEIEQHLAQARREVKKLKAEIESGDMQRPDIHYAYQKALRVENLALAKYAKVLVIVADLTLNRKAPYEDSESKCG